jgi:hypothetical protein
MTYQHLKERSHYETLYDEHTVERCRWHEEPRPISEREHDAGGQLSTGQLQWCHDLVTDWMIFQLAGNRYLQREETIDEWIERDKKRDSMLERAQMPYVRCSSCERVMELAHKHINFDIDDTKREWVEFFLVCKSCKQGKHVYENGSEIPRKPTLCIKCNREVELSTRKKNGKRYHVETCIHCGHVEEQLSYLDEKEKVPTQEELERFEYDKKRFCLTSTQGERYKHWVERMKRLNAQKEEQEANMEFYDKLAEVKKLNIAGLEKLLKTAIKKRGYADLHISMPPPDRQIILNFTVRDTEENRKEHESQKTLEDIIGNALEDKNWALMSDGVQYRLGLLSGRIRGYETEDDLTELTKSRMKKKMKSKRSKPYSELVS